MFYHILLNAAKTFGKYC